MDERSKALPGATVEMINLEDTLSKRITLTDADGAFSFENVRFGYYRLHIMFVGLQPLSIDSIYFRQERADFNLSDLVLKALTTENLNEVIVFAEKPLIESKDGNITFNAGESALAAGSNASELLASVPLVTKDADGKVSVRGKEPKILIDDKPVELNLQQLQDLLESMPGSSIEKIEVMINPPPQYANEQGGVINIVTKKGRVGRSGRISLSAGSRGEASMNGSFTYRKQGISLRINAGGSYNRFTGSGYSRRENLYADSSNLLTTANEYLNKSLRPNLRANLDYDINKLQSLNLVLQMNANDYANHSETEYTNFNRFGDIYRLSERSIQSEGNSYNGSLGLSYLVRTRRPGERLRIITNMNRSYSDGDRDFYQQFFHPDHSPNGIDSTQQQLSDNKNSGYSVRVNYERPLNNNKTTLSFGSFYTLHSSDVKAEASFLKKPAGILLPLDLLSNSFIFHQAILNARGSVRQMIGKEFNATVGLSVEQTRIYFDLRKAGREARNNYYTWLPFANINKHWQDEWSLTLSWRRSIRRPGINELNPTIDFSNPYNIRFGNERLEASTADNFDLVVGKTNRAYYINLGMGHNLVKDIFSRVRTLLPDGKTQITWENISGRKEYEVSTWGGLTLARKLKMNMSASYTFNQYSAFDRKVNLYRNGHSITSNLSTTFSPSDIMNFTGSFNINRFANPQGYARWNWSMNLGVRRKFFERRLTVTLNVIDPIIQQHNSSFVYGPNFNLESFSTATTRNYRLSLGYNLIRSKAKIKM